MQPGEPALTQLQGAVDEESRYRDALSLDSEADRAVLLARLSDPSWRVRKAAVERLCASKTPEVLVKELLEKLGEGDNVGERNGAAQALARIGPTAVDGLVGSLKAGDAQVRKLAADVLGEAGERRASAALIAALEDADPNVRAAAAEALGKLGGDEAALALERALDPRDRPLALAALEALSRLHCSPPLAVLESLASDPYLRRSALRLLGLAPGRAALGLIAQGLQDPSRGTREAAFEALAMQAGSLGALALRELVQALSPEARLAERAREALSAASAGAVAGALGALGLAGGPGRRVEDPELDRRNTPSGPAGRTQANGLAADRGIAGTPPGE